MRIHLLIVILAGVGLLAAACGGGAASQPALSKPSEARLATAARTAPDIALATLDGEFLLSQKRGDVLLLYFSFPG